MRRSRKMLEGPDRAAARAMWKATGLSDADLEKPIVAVIDTWTEGGPCNLGLRDLAAHVKDGVRAAAGTPIEASACVSCARENPTSEGLAGGT